MLFRSVKICSLLVLESKVQQGLFQHPIGVVSNKKGWFHVEWQNHSWIWLGHDLLLVLPALLVMCSTGTLLNMLSYVCTNTCTVVAGFGKARRCCVRSSTLLDCWSADLIETTMRSFVTPFNCQTCHLLRNLRSAVLGQMGQMLLHDVRHPSKRTRVLFSGAVVRMVRTVLSLSCTVVVGSVPGTVA